MYNYVSVFICVGIRICIIC